MCFCPAPVAALLALAVPLGDGVQPPAGVDASGLTGLPRAGSAQFLADVRSAVAETAGLPERPRFLRAEEVTETSRCGNYPLCVAWEVAGREPVPLVLLPDLSDFPETHPPADPADSGRTVLFESGQSGPQVRVAPPLPGDAVGISEGLLKFFPLRAVGRFTANYGAAFGPDFARDERLRPLRLGEPGGARVVAEIVTTRLFPDNPRVLRYEVREPGETPRAGVAFAMVDANGANRLPRPEAGLHGFALPLVSPPHDPRVGKHSLLRLPNSGRDVPPRTERPGPPGDGSDGRTIPKAVEVLAMDGWFAARPEKLWALRAADDYRPFHESFLLAPATERGDRPLHSLYLFDGWDAARIAAELRGVQTPPDQGEAVASPSGDGPWRP